MRIANNIMAMNAHRQLTFNQTQAARAMERLSSGLRINRAGDDAAGLAISEKMRGQIRGLTMAGKNAQDAISLIQTAEGALNETHAILQRMRELAVQAASDTNTDADRAELQKEVDQLAIELTRIANNTEFNTQTLLNGAIQEGNIGELGFHIGANEGQYIKLSIGAMDAFSLGVARNVLSASVVPGTHGITGASLEGDVGKAIQAGTPITVSVANDPGSQASGTLTIGTNTGDLTIEANEVGSALNNVSIEFGGDNDGDIVVQWDDTTETLTVSADWDGSSAGGALTLGDLQNAINTKFAELGFATVTLSVAGTFTASEFANKGPLTLDNGSDPNQSVTFQAGGYSQTVDVDPDHATVRVTSGAFQGLTLTLEELRDSDIATINITDEKARAAVFQDREKVDDAFTAGGIDVSSRDAADKAISIIQSAIDRVSAERSKLGAYQNRLEHTIANLGVSAENLQAAESRIRDVDMAAEMMTFTKYQILQQASTAMLAQANLAPQSVLQLLG